jgi:dGTPase
MTELFNAYMSEPQQLPPHILERHVRGDEPMPRVISDYIAGMTDRFVIEDHRKLFDPLERG